MVLVNTRTLFVLVLKLLTSHWCRCADNRRVSWSSSSQWSYSNSWTSGSSGGPLGGIGQPQINHLQSRIEQSGPILDADELINLFINPNKPIPEITERSVRQSNQGQQFTNQQSNNLVPQPNEQPWNSQIPQPNQQPSNQGRRTQQFNPLTPQFNNAPQQFNSQAQGGQDQPRQSNNQGRLGQNFAPPPQRPTPPLRPTNGREEQGNSQPRQSNNQPRQVNRWQDDEDDRPVWGVADTKPDVAKFKSKGTTNVFENKEVPTEKKIPTTEKTISRIVEEEEELWVPGSMKDFVTTPSLKHCLNYCEFPSGASFAAGGQNVRLHEFPHMVALGFGRGNFQGRSLVAWNSCGGSLISKNFVLTAAHCLDSEMGPPTVVRIGEHDLSRTDEGAQPQDFPILRIFPHPAYNASKSLYNDIALLQLTRNVNFTRHMRPACLHQGLNLKRNEIAYINVTSPVVGMATGWGNTGFADAPADILQKVKLDIIDNKTCRKFLGTDPFIPNGVEESTQVCAGILAGGVDTCLGDSGGPLQVNNTIFHYQRQCPMEIVGITSFGRYCAEANSPSVYTRVSAYVPWIESIVWPTKPTRN